MAPSLTILGGGGWFPAHGRHTACALLRSGPSAIAIDAGTGVVRLAEQPELLAGVDRLDFVLSHFHFDHIAGLMSLPVLAGHAEITIWGPGERLFGSSTASILSTICQEPYHPVPLEEQGIKVLDLPDGELQIGDHVVRTRRQERHSCPTLGLRFDDTLTWITDTAYDAASAPFAAGSRLLAHEAWFVRGDPRTPELHSSASEAASVAREAGLDELLLIHLPPFSAGLDHLVAEAEAGGVRAHLARDCTDLSALLGAVPAQA